MNPQNNKERMRQHLHLMPVAATVTATDRFIKAVDVLLAQLAKNVVRKQMKEGFHDPDRRTEKVP